MTSASTGAEYRDQLRRLLDRGKDTLTDEELATLRAVVRSRRNGRRGSEQIQVSTAIEAHVVGIVDVLESAAKVLRPRETQELDDYVNGIEKPAPDRLAGYAPVRLHRRGSN